jgi:hypothetical protein
MRVRVGRMMCVMGECSTWCVRVQESPVCGTQRCEKVLCMERKSADKRSAGGCNMVYGGAERFRVWYTTV